MVHVDSRTALVIMILNIVLPGVGTLIGSCTDWKGCNMAAFTYGMVIMFLTVSLGIGWLISILHGC